MEEEKKYQVLIGLLERNSSINQNLNESIGHIIGVTGILVALSSGLGAFFISLLKDRASNLNMLLLALILVISIVCYLLSLKIGVEIVTRFSAFKRKGEELLDVDKIPLGKKDLSWENVIRELSIKLSKLNEIINIKYAKLKRSKRYLYIAMFSSIVYIVLALCHLLV